MHPDLFTDLSRRGYIHQCTDEQVFSLYDKGQQALYIGFDPTADSLHLGNYCALMHAVQYMKKGNKLYALVGGATGMIGDPGGRDSERTFIDEATLQNNFNAITTQIGEALEHIQALSGIKFSYEIVNNKDFYKDISFIDFLRDVGKYMTVNAMISRDTVKKRIADPGQSISYTEFSYMMLQGYDYYHLHTHHGVSLQLGASDQRGNIVTGVELIRKKADSTVYGVTCPLLLDSSGKKFGKSAGNAIRLNPEKTTPYEMYQYFYNQADEDVERFLLQLTLLSFDEIDTIVAKHRQAPEKRYGQALLARHVCRILYDEQTATRAQQTSQLVFGNDPLTVLEHIDDAGYETIARYIGGSICERKTRIIDLLVQGGICSSNKQARTLIEQKCIWINNRCIEDIQDTLQPDDWTHNYILLRKGKKDVHILSCRDTAHG